MASIGKETDFSIRHNVYFSCKFVVAFQQFYFDISFIWKLIV